MIFDTASLPLSLKESARAWNRVEKLREERAKNPDVVSQDDIERAALDWFEKSAKAGRRNRS